MLQKTSASPSPVPEAARKIRHRGLILVAIPSQLVPDCWGFEVWREQNLVAFKNGQGSAARALSEARAAANEYLADRSEL